METGSASFPRTSRHALWSLGIKPPTLWYATTLFSHNAYLYMRNNFACHKNLNFIHSMAASQASYLLFPHLNCKLFWRRPLKDRPKSLICAPRSEDRGTRSNHRGAMSEDTRVRPHSSLSDDRGSLWAEWSGTQTPPPQLEHLNKVAEKQFKFKWPIFTCLQWINSDVLKWRSQESNDI